MHDFLYKYAVNPDEISRADYVTIGKFYDLWLCYGNPHAAAGALGLSVKYVAEKIFGVQYPRMPPALPTPKNWAALRVINARKEANSIIR